MSIHGIDFDPRQERILSPAAVIFLVSLMWFFLSLICGLFFSFRCPSRTWLDPYKSTHFSIDLLFELSFKKYPSFVPWSGNIRLTAFWLVAESQQKKKVRLKLRGTFEHTREVGSDSYGGLSISKILYIHVRMELHNRITKNYS